MREAVGSAFLVNLILVFIGVISALLVGSISYSKAYKVKNRILYVIEKYDGFDDTARKELASSLRSVGYKISSGDNSSCESIYRKKLGSSFKRENLLHGVNDGVKDFDYCVYKYTCDETGGSSCVATYYGVTSFMHFDIPLIGGMLEFPVNGETSLVYDVIDN